MASTTNTSAAISGKLFKLFLADKTYWYDKKLGNAIEVSVNDEEVSIDSATKISEIADDAVVAIVSGEAFSTNDILGQTVVLPYSLQSLYEDWHAMQPSSNLKTKYEAELLLSLTDIDELYQAAGEVPNIKATTLTHKSGEVNIAACIRVLLKHAQLPGMKIGSATVEKQDTSKVFPLLD